MIHKDELGEHAAHFPHDQNGHIPEPGDHWSKMSFEYGPNSPDEPGIDETEKARRIEYLDKVWWPQILTHAQEGRKKLQALPGGSPIKHWRDEVIVDPPMSHGFQVE